MINFYAGHQSAFKKPLLYAAFGFALLYPLMVHWNMADYRIGIIHSSDISWNVLLIHYLALGLLLKLGRLVVKRIHRHNVKNTPLREGLSLVTILFLIFILCTEYDNLSVIMSAFQNNALSQTTTVWISLRQTNTSPIRSSSGSSPLGYFSGPSSVARSF